MVSHRAFHPLIVERLPLLDGVPAPGLHDTPEVTERRRAFDAPFAEPNLPPVAVRDVEAPGPNGPIRLRMYLDPDRNEPAPGLVWIHGGAFTHGDLEVPEADHFARQMAHRTGAVVFSVEYRLCDGRVRFPVPHDDCYAAYRWVGRHARELGVDPARIAVGGGSAGACLAASVALHASDAGTPPWQMLLAYPLVHVDLPAPGEELAEAMAITPPALCYSGGDSRGINEYVMGRPTAHATPYDFPALAPDYSRFPPAYIENCEFDEFRASGEAFAEGLAAAGVPVETVTAEGVPHGHLNAVGSPMLEDAYRRFARRLTDGPGA